MRTRWIVFLVLLALWAIGSVSLYVYAAEHADHGGVFGGFFEVVVFEIFTVNGLLMLIEMAILNCCL